MNILNICVINNKYINKQKLFDIKIISSFDFNSFVKILLYENKFLHINLKKMNEQQDANSDSTLNSNNDDKKKRWELLPKIKQGLDELSNQNKNNPKIKALQLALEKMINMKNHLSKQENDLKLGKLISLRERNAYLEKLRQIEEYGENLDWKDDEGFLNQINNLLYND